MGGGPSGQVVGDLEIYENTQRARIGRRRVEVLCGLEALCLEPADKRRIAGVRLASRLWWPRHLGSLTLVAPQGSSGLDHAQEKCMVSF